MLGEMRDAWRRSCVGAPIVLSEDQHDPPPLPPPTRAAYGASQLPRIAWYLGHGLAMTRIAQRARESGSARPRPHTDASIPDRKRFFADMGALWQQDLANVEAGVYPLPADHDGSLKMLLHRSRLFFEDLPAIRRRRESGDHSEVLSEETRGKRPRYYLQNFHFQSGGWMTDEAAQRCTAAYKRSRSPVHAYTRHDRRREFPSMDSRRPPTGRSSRNATGA